ncbi:hypothetical protein HB943_14105 [Listeria weihenstephanensis]|uniref:BIG2 domain-containing protein n=1 Tax=Listeria weihenstephanensis TaxID=1006155 RepID=A0A841ZB73_9LIST|nr:toxin Cry1Ac domain D-VI-related protein [Listeria weihenstephanensis]MBC1501737.1 hypothetical protein [Listeria weihenstephanensis]
MNKNFKKAAIALLATNVIASTVLTALPAVETHAAENKLTAGLLQATQSNILNTPYVKDKQITGRIPGAINKTVTIKVLMFLGAGEENGYPVLTGSVQTDSDGNYVYLLSAYGAEGLPSQWKGHPVGVQVTEASTGISVTTAIQTNPSVTGYINSFKVGDSVITGHIDNFANRSFRIFSFDDIFAVGPHQTQYPNIYTTDANGSFTADLPFALQHIGVILTTPDNIGLISGIDGVDSRSIYTPTTLNINTTSINAQRGAVGQITTSILPSIATQTVTYTSSNPGIITVDANGNWTAIAAGSASITVKSTMNPELEKTIPVTVSGTTADIARVAVNDLFIDNNPANHIKSTTDQAAIDAAQIKVNAVTNDPTQRNELQGQVDKAQAELNTRTKEAAATASVNDLFINNNPANHIKDTTNQAAIDAAQAKVNQVMDTAKKAELQGQVDKAQAELNVRAKEVAATVAVSDLFINNDPANHIKDTTNQAAIDAAQAKVNQVTDTAKKAELQGQVDKAQAELNARAKEAAATASVNDLFINNNPANHIKDTTNQVAIDAAQAKVNQVTDTAKKTELQGQVDKAQAELNAAAAEKVAKASVDALFADAPANTVLRDNTTQAMIDAASAKVNVLPASADKTAMQGDINTANTLFNKITQTTINSLTTTSTSVSGVGEPNSSIVIKNGATTIASGKVASDGTYVFNITPQPGLATITATVTKAANSKTSSASTTVADDSIAPTTIQPMTVESTTVSGTGEANGNIVIKNGATTIASGKVASDGNYLFFVPKQAAGSTITATITKPSNSKISSASTTIADDSIVPTTISSMTTDSTSISGNGEPNGNIVIKNGATTIASGKVASDGTYLFNITKQAGGSTITATVTKPSNGKTSSASTTIADDSIVKTTISALTSDSTSISGVGEPNGNIVIKNGATTIASGKVASDGTYLFNITKQAGGSTITATVTKPSNGKTSSASTTIADDSIVKTTISALTSDSTSISGVGEPNGNIVIKNGATTIASGKVASDGTYLFNITKQAGGSTITATVTKPSNGKTSSASTTIADESIAPTTIGALTVDSTTVTGTGEANGSIVIKNGATTIASGTVSSNGAYSIIIPKQAAGSIITATVTKTSNGKTSSANTTIPTPATDYSLSATAYKVGNATLTGKYGKNIAKVRLWVNDVVVAQATTKSDGTYRFTGVTSFVTKPTDKVEVVGVDGGYVERNRVRVAVTGDPIYDYSLTVPASYALGTANITGTYGKDVSKVRLFVNGAVVAQASTANGTYAFTNVPNYVKLSTDKVEIVAVNSAYQEVARKAVSVSGTSILDYKLTANDYAKGSQTLTGTYGKDVSKVRLWVNGAVVGQASTTGGNFTFTNIASFITNKDDKVEVVGVDAQYKEVNRVTVNKTGFSNLDNTLTGPAAYYIGTDTMTGAYGTNVSKVRLVVNGVIVKQASTLNGTYTLAGISSQIKLGDTVEIVGVDGQYKEVNRISIPVQNNPVVKDYALTVNPYALGGYSMTGTFGKDITFVRLFVNGVMKKQAAITGNSYSLNAIADYITSSSDVVEVAGLDSGYKEVNRISVSVQ